MPKFHLIADIYFEAADIDDALLKLSKYFKDAHGNPTEQEEILLPSSTIELRKVEEENDK
mgnify:CR=1 FL=1